MAQVIPPLNFGGDAAPTTTALVAPPPLFESGDGSGLSPGPGLSGGAALHRNLPDDMPHSDSSDEAARPPAHVPPRFCTAKHTDPAGGPAPPPLFAEPAAPVHDEGPPPPPLFGAPDAPAEPARPPPAAESPTPVANIVSTVTHFFARSPEPDEEFPAFPSQGPPITGAGLPTYRPTPVFTPSQQVGTRLVANSPAAASSAPADAAAADQRPPRVIQEVNPRFFTPTKPEEDPKGPRYDLNLVVLSARGIHCPAAQCFVSVLFRDGSETKTGFGYGAPDSTVQWNQELPATLSGTERLTFKVCIIGALEDVVLGQVVIAAKEVLLSAEQGRRIEVPLDAPRAPAASAAGATLSLAATVPVLSCAPPTPELPIRIPAKPAAVQQRKAPKFSLPPP